MIKEAVGFGETVDEARQDAMLALGASPEADVQIEILEMPKKKVLGMFGGTRAKVRVFVELPDREEKAQVKKQKTTQKKEKKAVEEKPQKEKVKKEKKEKPKADENVYGVAVDASEIDVNSNAGKAVKYLKEVLSGLGCADATIKVAEKDNGVLISLDGEGLGSIIGRRGETLEALRVLTALSVNRGGGYYRVNINIGDYREKREQALISLASRIAKQVLSSGRNRSLEPMSPYERRIIHTAVQEIEGVESNSVGEGENRRVVIHIKGKSAVPDRDSRRARGHRRTGRTDKVQPVSDREPLKDSDIPLYGKIEK